MTDFKDLQDYEQGLKSSDDKDKDSLNEDRLQNKPPVIISGSLIIYPEN